MSPDPLRVRLMTLRDDIRSTPMLHAADAAARERWGDALSAILAAALAVPEGASKSWLTLCPDCDHGIRGGAPCETCSGGRYVEVVFAAALRAAPAAEEPMTDLPDLEVVAAEVHNAWMASKRAQGVTTRRSESGEELMVPYGQLSEAAKELDRGSVRAVYAAIKAARAAAPQEPKCQQGHVWSNQFGDDWTPDVGTLCDCGKKQWDVATAPQEP